MLTDPFQIGKSTQNKPVMQNGFTIAMEKHLIKIIFDIDKYIILGAGC